jgi:predicted tellurium resistance membrane protein TerC
MFDFSWIMTGEGWMALLTLAVLEIILGVDNIIFISILVARVEESRRQSARIMGLGLAMVTRIMLLFSLVWLANLTKPWFAIAGHEFSGRHLVLLVGGLFLIAKSVHEIHASLEEVEGHDEKTQRRWGGFGAILIQIALIDIVFSLDSVITAVGMCNQLMIMVLAVVAAVLVMMWAAKPIGEFIDMHPSLKMLALAFLILIGFTLVLEGWGEHVSKGYIYTAMAFAFGVEILNIVRRTKSKAVRLRQGLLKELPGEVDEP